MRKISKYISILLATMLIFFISSCQKNNNKTPDYDKIDTIYPAETVTERTKEEEEFDTLRTKGLKAMQQNQLTDAIIYLLKALEIRPDEDLKLDLADCYYERGNFYIQLEK